MSNFRTYSDLIKLNTFDERFNYLKLNSQVGDYTFGSNRYLNQGFYNSYEWKKFKEKVIIRDGGCDLGVEGYDIFDKIIIHHLNPITVEDILKREEILMDMNNVICVSHNTHMALHYGCLENTAKPYSPRYKNDTIPWR